MNLSILTYERTIYLEAQSKDKNRKGMLLKRPNAQTKASE
jgi:hypothetical protein